MSIIDHDSQAHVPDRLLVSQDLCRLHTPILKWHLPTKMTHSYTLAECNTSLRYKKNCLLRLIFSQEHKSQPSTPVWIFATLKSKDKYSFTQQQKNVASYTFALAKALIGLALETKALHFKGKILDPQIIIIIIIIIIIYSSNTLKSCQGTSVPGTIKVL